MRPAPTPNGIAIFLICLCSALLPCQANAQERRIVTPFDSPKPIGPYSPGLLFREYLYVSGQGARDSSGAIPAGIASQSRQCLENVKSVVAAAGLSMAHIAHVQVYLERISDLPAFDRAFVEYFPEQPPARIVVGVSRMPADTPVEITAVVVRNLKDKKVLKLRSLQSAAPASPAIMVGKRIYFSGVYGSSAADAEAQMKKALREAGIETRQVLLSNFYSTSPQSLIPVTGLPGEKDAAYSVIGTRGRVVRVAADNGICALEGRTVFCSVQAGSDFASRSVSSQVREIMQKLFAGLEAHGTNLAMAAATNVYLYDLRDFKTMNDTYASFFRSDAPTRTTVQGQAAGERQASGPLVRISLIAVKE